MSAPTITIDQWFGPVWLDVTTMLNEGYSPEVVAGVLGLGEFTLEECTAWIIDEIEREESCQ